MIVRLILVWKGLLNLNKRKYKMKYLIILLFLPSCWAFMSSDGEDLCRFTKRHECGGGYRLVKVSPTNETAKTVPENNSEKPAQ